MYIKVVVRSISSSSKYSLSYIYFDVTLYQFIISLLCVLRDKLQCHCYTQLWKAGIFQVTKLKADIAWPGWK